MVRISALLLLTMFYRHLKPVIENGFLYVAQPPLFKVSQGKKIEYVYFEEKKDEVIKKFR